MHADPRTPSTRPSRSRGRRSPRCVVLAALGAAAALTAGAVAATGPAGPSASAAVTAAIGPVLYQDNFDGAGTLDAGTGWIVNGGTTWTQSGGSVTVSGQDGVALRETGVADVSVQSSITLAGSATAPSLSFRAVDRDNQLLVGLVRRTNGADEVRAVRMFKSAGGGTIYDPLDAEPVSDLEYGGTYVLRVDAIGPDIRVFVDDVEVLQYTLTADEMAAFGANTRHGLRTAVASGTESQGSSWNDLLITDLRPASGTTTTTPTTPTTLPSAGSSGYISLTPARLLDTRPAGTTVDGLQQRDGIRAAGTVTQLQVAGRGGVPADATAAVLNLTATVTGGAGFATMWPCDQPEPNASNLNYTDHDVANAVIAKLDATGKVCIRNSATTHLIADVNGAIPAGGAFTSLTPARLLDTRPAGTTVDGLQQREGIRAAGTVTQLQVAGRGGVPADATAAVLNLTATVTGGAGFATMWPCDQPEPNASNLNYTDHDVANAVIAKLDATGKVCIRNSATTHLIADVNGAIPAGGAFTSLTPARLLDTRPAGTTVDGLQQRDGIRAAGTVTQLQVAGRGGVPADATAAVLNLTATVTGGAGFATMWPCDQPEPNASNLNYTDHDVANAVIAKLDATGKVCIRNSATTHLIADVNGSTK